MSAWQSGLLLRRTLFVLGNLCTFVLLLNSIAGPIQALFVQREHNIIERRELLARLSAIAGEEANVASMVRKVDAQITGHEFLAGSNENAISAELQAHLKTLVGTSGAQARMVQALPTRSEGILRYVGARIDMSGTIRTIQAAIYAIENASPHLVVVEGSIKPLMAIASSENREMLLQAQLDVFGALRPAGGEK